MTREEIIKKAKPILFNTEMVRANRDGKKTVTRRVMKPQPIYLNGLWHIGLARWSEGNKTIHPVYGHSLYNRMPYKPGDYLYVRETWARTGIDVDPIFFEHSSSLTWGQIIYKADGWNLDDIGRWRPSIHMPKEAARIFLRVTDIKVERLKDMTADSAMSEGFADWNDAVRVWDSTIKKENIDKYGWNANPWVWVIEYEKAETEN